MDAKKRFLRIASFSLGITLALIAEALGAPSVSSITGTQQHNSQITITGSGFGSKPQATPVLWENFEAGTSGQIIAGSKPVYGPSWTDFSTLSQSRPTFTNASQRHSLSALSSHHDFVTAGNYNSSLKHYGQYSTVYLSFWWRYERLPGAPYSRNVKAWTEYGSQGNFPMAYTGMGDPSAGDGTIRNSVQDNNTLAGPVLWGKTSIASIEREWVRFEMYLVQSSPGTPDGVFSYWTQRPNASSPSVTLEGSNTSYTTRLTSNTWHLWEFGSYYDNNPSTARAHVYIDDIYLDTTPARVEIGNASTWNASTRREIQTPTQWSSTAITVKVNQGSFASLANTYLYVIDSNGTVNANGYPLCSSNCPSPPAAPKNLRAQ